ncbi:MAG: DUF2283 domain-containing protein [Anaerolineae bacterium]|nr:DUF2283 domain-containing protein [Anaerolineae bacterium]
MAENLTFQYDREADILYINTVSPYAEQESDELGDEIIARLNPKTGRIENLEVLFFTSRLLRKELISLPITADLRLVDTTFA